MEWGCGNGRDSNLLSAHCKAVLAVDIAKSDHATNFEHSNLKHLFGYDFTDLRPQKVNVVYSRFSLHSVSKIKATKALLWAKQNLLRGGYLLIEARSIRDPLYGQGTPVKGEEHAYIASSGADDKEHYRRFIDLKQLAQELKDIGFDIKYAADDNDLSVYKGDNPYLVRVIAKSSADRN